MLEPDALKGASPVLRRERASNRSFLFNTSVESMGAWSIKMKEVLNVKTHRQEIQGLPIQSGHYETF
jgi:hypothetical protein